MASNVALKRARRAVERKRDMAQQRRLELVESRVGAQARRAAQTPIRRCLLHGDVEDGMANIILARGSTPHRLTTAFFLVDTYCLGVKDIALRDLDRADFDAAVEAMGATERLTEVEPAYGRKLIRDAAAWAASIGFRPHRDLVAVEQIFGDVEADACTAEFVFGKDGKPLYIPGPTETAAQVRQRLAHLMDQLGKDGFDCLMAL
ncbi:MAG TPA: hypothetical protein VMU93_00295 [Caulobacteraceae bacterium]|nr:hypothetical protein [Caulobacteraceae bacterium]